MLAGEAGDESRELRRQGFEVDDGQVAAGVVRVDGAPPGGPGHRGQQAGQRPLDEAGGLVNRMVSANPLASTAACSGLGRPLASVRPSWAARNSWRMERSA